MLTDTDHRPWPLPNRPWIMHMRWLDLLFIHWPLAPEILRALIPAALTLDTYDGRAWLGVVPFRMTNVRPRWIPPVPGLSAFAEINVRTYVTCDGKPGVWFFSLDAVNHLAVWGARWSFHLPYYFADMTVQERDGRIHYHTTRRPVAPGEAHFTAVYGPTGAVYFSQPGSLEHWLTERYCLYAADRHGHIHRSDIHHARWPLQPAVLDLKCNTMTAPLRVTLPATEPLLHFARRLDVVAWLLEPACSATTQPVT
jgi:uncharacterized protein YqjF (DUF2071 family)